MIGSVNSFRRIKDRKIQNRGIVQERTKRRENAEERESRSPEVETTDLNGVMEVNPV